jgi:7,8-dihydropterin-6-yl-methyl-4-(beta-D-ribofuranosyl)aminobenzene 5'-phosphate synthase
MRQAIPTFVAWLVIAEFVFDHPSTAQTQPASPNIVITNVYDAFGSERAKLTHDFGFSAVVQYKGKMILFDAGTNAEIFQRHLEAMGIEAKKIDVAIVSHGHYDHIGGFDYLLSANPNVTIYLPNDFFTVGAPINFPFRSPEANIAEQLPKEQRYYGGAREVSEVRSSGRFWKARVEYVTAAKEILPGVTLIPTTSALMGTFIKYPPFDQQPQLIGMPELTASFATEKGEVVIAGCSHSSIETIVQETKKILQKKIHLVAGGFHLVPYDRNYIEGLATRLQDEYGVESVAPAHCTGHLAFAIFRKAFGDKYKFFGLGEEIKL